MTRHGSRDLVRVLGLQSSNVSATVRSLVQLGLVARTSTPATDGPPPAPDAPPLAERNDYLIRRMWITGVARLLSEMEPDDAAALVAVAPLLERLAALSADHPLAG